MRPGDYIRVELGDITQVVILSGDDVGTGMLFEAVGRYDGVSETGWLILTTLWPLFEYPDVKSRISQTLIPYGAIENIERADRWTKLDVPTLEQALSWCAEQPNKPESEEDQEKGDGEEMDSRSD